MRTTIDLPDDVLSQAKSLARARQQSLGQAVTELIRRGLNPPAPARISVSPISGLPVLHLAGDPISEQDVHAFEAEEDERLLSVLRRTDDAVG